MASMMSAGHSMAWKRFARLCRKEWMTQPSSTCGFSHLFSAALAELSLYLVSLQYFGKANVEPTTLIICAAHSEVPTGCWPKRSICWMLFAFTSKDSEKFNFKIPCIHWVNLSQKTWQKRTSKSRPEFKGENMKKMFIFQNDFLAKILVKCEFLVVKIVLGSGC